MYVFFLTALSLSGVFEIGTSLMGAGSELTSQDGYKGSFFTGVLATTVATPCTAPFMGPAIGFALTQSWLVAMFVFVSLGFGMALPILILSFTPALFKYLPKPGPWMETFKQFMAFPLYASALFFVGFRQSGWGHGYVPSVECLHSICTCSLALPAALNYGLIPIGVTMRLVLGHLRWLYI